MTGTAELPRGPVDDEVMPLGLAGEWPRQWPWESNSCLPMRAAGRADPPHRPGQGTCKGPGAGEADARLQLSQKLWVIGVIEAEPAADSRIFT